MVDASTRRLLERLLGEARDRGHAGPSDPGEHLAHAERMAEVVSAPPAACCDLGSGAGVPALVLATLWPATEMALVESMARRARWLERCVAELGLDDRCTVLHERAEMVGRDPDYRERFDLVTARAFARPPVTAECGAPLLRVGGRLLASEPPTATPERWPAEHLSALGLGHPVTRVVGDPPASFVVIEKQAPTGDRYPRPPGRPAKHPLW